MKLIAYSLFGYRQCYIDGLLWNTCLAARYFPGWTVRAYVDETMGRAIEWLESRGCQVVKMKPAEGLQGMWWRMLAAADPAAKSIIFRDADSCLCARDADAVSEWEESGLVAHSMHDHPAHGKRLMGGMWGVRGGILPNIAELIAAQTSRKGYGEDETFLEKVIYPRFAGSVLHHSSLPMPWPTKAFRLEKETMIGEMFFKY